MKKTRLTMAQALVKYLTVQHVEMDNGKVLPYFGGCWAIFGHGNVAGLGEALYHAQDKLPTFRAHNEQSMAHAAIGFGKATKRQRAMIATSSIGPGATNMVTAAALAHSNRLPILLLPGDTFARRTPDPVLQQIEDFSDPNVTANDCFKPVSRFFDRIYRPEQLISSLPQAIAVLRDPAECGPVTLALPQDVQAEAFDYPESFFEPITHRLFRAEPDRNELAAAVALLKTAKKPLIIAGGGVHYSLAFDALKSFAEKHGIPVCETQAGKGAIDHTLSLGGLGVTGSDAANRMMAEADVVVAVGTRLSDFTTASRTTMNHAKFISLNAGRFDAGKHHGLPLRADTRQGLLALSAALGDWKAGAQDTKFTAEWQKRSAELCAATDELPSDAQVVGAVARGGNEKVTVVAAAGSFPAELQRHWPASAPDGYHVEYGYSCMGYEIAGAIGAKMALPERDVIVFVGDGSYLMANSEIATSVALKQKLIIIVCDNRGFGCINRLQKGTGNAPFNNLLEDAHPKIDFAAHAAAMGAASEKVNSISELEAALKRAKAADKTYVIALDTTPHVSTSGLCWWDVGVPETSPRKEVVEAHKTFNQHRPKQPY